MVKVSIIGAGNVAQHLAKAFTKTPGIELSQVYSRSQVVLSEPLSNIEVVSDLNQLKDADLYLMAVSDDAISELSSQLPFERKLVAHTSGGVSIDALNSRNKRAVFYPLQTFTKNKAVDFREIPICLESENSEDFELLQQVAFAISDQVFAIGSQQRKAIHVSAVFVSNFVNHMYVIGNDICTAHQLPFGILKPLIAETAAKINDLSPAAAQTGPAKRHDQKTITAHLDMLEDDNQRRIYQLLTQSIQSHE